MSTSKPAGPMQFFTADHRTCDELWGAVETAAQAKNAAAARAAWQAFDHAMRRHFGMEEEVLFPALEARTGMVGGPTAVMREEHAQMRGVLDQMAGAAAGEDWNGVVDLGDTLLMLIQQHNVKEEGILYPMAEQALACDWDELWTRLARYA